MSTDKRGPLAIYSRYERHLDGQECRGTYRPFEWSEQELQEPVDECHLERLGEVFQWQIGEYRERIAEGVPCHVPSLVHDPSSRTARIKLDTGHLLEEVQLPCTD